jgi:hypothetical protein
MPSVPTRCAAPAPTSPPRCRPLVIYLAGTATARPPSLSVPMPRDTTAHSPTTRRVGSADHRGQPRVARSWTSAADWHRRPAVPGCRLRRDWHRPRRADGRVRTPYRVEVEVVALEAWDPAKRCRGRDLDSHLMCVRLPSSMLQCFPVSSRQVSQIASHELLRMAS